MKSSLFAPVFHIGTINIGSIEGASCFNIGNNEVRGFHSTKKINQGVGNIHGSHNRFPQMGILLDDSDRNDMVSGIENKKKE